jgi:outer membrane immunogenic protein
MKKISITGALVSGAMLGALAVGSAMAADMPVKAPYLKAPPPMAYSWTGCYINAGAGYGLWNQDLNEETDPGHVATTATGTAGGRGWFGTAGAGCDYQVSSSIVIGAYGDFDFGDIKGNVAPIGVGVVGNESEKSAWAGGARIGWLVTPTFLTYVSGGYTQAHFDPVNFTTSAATGGPVLATVASHTYTGYFLGSGFEYGISFLPAGFFLRSEYRFSTYQADDLSVLTPTGALTGFAYNSKKYEQSIRSELVWRFSMGH